MDFQTWLGVAAQDDVLIGKLIIGHILFQDFKKKPCDVCISLTVLLVGFPLRGREVFAMFAQSVYHFAAF